MNQPTFTTWKQIERLSSVQFMLAEMTVLQSIDRDRLDEILEEDGGLVLTEGVRFTPGGNFVKALTGSGQVVETAIELVS